MAVDAGSDTMGLLDRFRRRTGGRPEDQRAIAEQAFERGKQAYFHHDDYRQAAAEFARAVELAPDSVDSQCLLGASLVQLGDNDGAIPPLRQCLALAPEHDVGHYLLGMALSRLDRFDEGEVHLAKAVQLGNEPARELMTKLGIDYCRKCTRPVHRSAPIEADVVFRSPPFGAKCPDCGMVICWACFVPAGETSHIDVQNPPCPACGHAMLPYEA
jgi:tetratricopeptide (TPR) repeat protein